MTEQHLLSDAEFRADCDKCAALCCVAFAFDRSDDFGLDKKAGEVCPNLDGMACMMHGERAAQGFAGCIAFDCHGAGEVVVQEMFGGRNWRDDPAVFEPMMEAFRASVPLQKTRWLLHLAARLPLSVADRQRCDQLQAVTRDFPRWTAEQLLAFARNSWCAEVEEFLSTLKSYVAAPTQAGTVAGQA